MDELDRRIRSELLAYTDPSGVDGLVRTTGDRLASRRSRTPLFVRLAAAVSLLALVGAGLALLPGLGETRPDPRASASAQTASPTTASPWWTRWQRLPTTEGVFTGGPDASGTDGGQFIAEIVSTPTGLVAVGSTSDADHRKDAAVWTSSDGIRWSRVANDGSFGADAVTPRNDFSDGNQGMGGVARWGEHLIAVGGEYSAPDLSTTLRAAVWVATDPMTWERLTPEAPAFAGATMSDVVVFGDRLIAVGVQPDGTGGLDSAVWTSPDGRRWARVEYQPAFDGADMSQVVVLGDRLIVLGRTGNEAGQQDGAVWTSDDGEAWLRIEDDDAFGGPGWQQINGVTVVSGSVVAVGTSYVLHDDHREARSVGVVWLSRDGENWRRVDDARGVFATDPLTSIQGVTAAGPGAIAVGSRAIPGEAPNAFDDRSRAAVWFSADGAVWEPLSDRPEFSSEPGLTMARMSVADDGRLIAFGTSYRELGSTGTSEGDIAVWISDAPEGALEVP